ncbi:MAG: divalent-cation tolerance protein CutA [Cyanobacteria bacterium HKST-UBA06]|nr:divalent-cation tolerance protein CutA [Cyanobacteria bacterium HKST-UBA06]
MGFVTAPSMAVARQLAHGLVEGKLAACVNLVPGLESIYVWQGKLAQEPEVLLIIKTTQGCWPALQDWVAQNHPYEVPEVIQVPIQAGLPAYLTWVQTSVELAKA